MANNFWELAYQNPFTAVIIVLIVAVAVVCIVECFCNMVIALKKTGSDSE